jgi:hypothetical protein
MKQVYETSKMLCRVSKTENDLFQFLKDIDPVEKFWKVYTKYEVESFEKFQASWPAAFDALAGPVNELESYCFITMLPGWKDEASHVLSKMKKLVHQQFFSFLVTRQEQDISEFYKEQIATSMTLQDWSLVWRSILLLCYDRQFCMSFGKEKIIFEGLAQDAHQNAIQATRMSSCVRCRKSLPWSQKRCRCCGHTVIHPAAPLCQFVFQPFYDSNGEIQPFPKEQLSEKLHIQIPGQLSNPTHVAYIVWKYCQCAALLSLQTK